MAKLLRVNMTKQSIHEEEVPKDYEMLGGRGLSSRILLDEVEATCHPLGPNNKLVIAPGHLTGTTCPNSGRLSFGGKSPLTGGIKESNAGTPCAHQIASLGYHAIIIEGQPEKEGEFYVLYLSPEGNRLEPAGELAGLGTYMLNEKIRERYQEKVYVICIGPAGEQKMCNAGISNNDPEGGTGRFAGRGGLGAVMGARGLKAIVIKAEMFKAPVKDMERFRSAAKKFAEILRKDPVSGEALPKYGTEVLMNIMNEAGGLPTKNFRYGRFDGAAKVSGEMLAKICMERGGAGTPTHNCHPGCVIRCSNIYPDKDGNAIVSPIEYETAWAFGPNLMIDDLDTIAMLNRICNDLGLDTIEAGGALGVAMEAGIIPFGDGEAAIKALREIGEGTPLGHILGQGAATVGRTYGVTRVASVKGQHLPAYDPRAVKGIGVTYAMTTMGADHTAGYSVALNVLKTGGFVDPLKTEGQVELASNLMVATGTLDSLGLCIFVSFALLSNKEGWPCILEMLEAKYGHPFSQDDIMAMGEQVLRVEREFNRRAGFSPAHDRLPEFFRKEPLAPHNTVFDVSDEEMDKMNEKFNMLK